MNEHDWIWRPNSIKFAKSYRTHPPEFGKQNHVFGSPFWTFELTLPPKDNDTRREIEAFFAKTEGRDVVNVYDPRVPYPKFYQNHPTHNGRMEYEAVIPDLVVKQTITSSSSIVVQGTSGDVISIDDPIAFTHLGYRHYYRSLETLVLDGTDQTLSVALRPRFNLTGLTTLAERIRPTQRFLIDINDIGGMTDVNMFTEYMLKGIEFPGAIT